MILYIGYTWSNTSNMWEYNYKVENEFDEEGNRISHCTYNYDSDSKQWQGIKKEETVYDEGKKTLFIVYNWNSTTNQWINQVRSEFSYYPSKSIEKGYNWDTLTSQWIIYYRHEISYDNEEHIILIESFDIDPDIGEWKYNNTVEHEYDVEGREILVKYSSWHYTREELTCEYKTETIYNEKGQKTLSLNYGWDINSNDWNLNSQKEYYYDTYGNSILDIDYKWDSANNQFELLRKNYYYYSFHDIYSYHIESNSTPISIYPNPVNEELNLYIAERIHTRGWLYNSNGSPVLIIDIFKGINTYDISKLQAGLYLIVLPTKNGNTHFKIIKK